MLVICLYRRSESPDSVLKVLFQNNLYQADINLRYSILFDTDLYKIKSLRNRSGERLRRINADIK